MFAYMMTYIGLLAIIRIMIIEAVDSQQAPTRRGRH